MLLLLSLVGRTENVEVKLLAEEKIKVKKHLAALLDGCNDKDAGESKMK